jgi:hypothetical protein
VGLEHFTCENDFSDVKSYVGNFGKGWHTMYMVHVHWSVSQI